MSLFILNIFGWNLGPSLPKNIKKAIVIVAPHTSNWDFILGLLYKWSTKITISYLIKEEWLNSPLGPWFKSTGAIGIKRSDPKNTTDQLSQTIKNKKNVILAITPEGTRSKVDRWKTGFYRIAKECNIPIYCAYLDYKKKEMGLLDLIITPSKNQKDDFQKIQTAYKNITPQNPKNYNPIIY